jgi:hypothetical protein
MKSKLGAAFPTALRPRDRRTLPSRQRTYIRLRARVDRLEDAISHFYNVINELRGRVSTLENNGATAEEDRVSLAGNTFGGTTAEPGITGRFVLVPKNLELPTLL